MKFKKQHFNLSKDFDQQIEEPEEYEERKKWFEGMPEDAKNFENCTEQVLVDLKDDAKKCHDFEVINYKIESSKRNSDYQWMRTVISKGTISDKIAAHTVAIQDNPVCNLETIRNLVGMVKVGKKKECFAVIENLTELFTSDLLRPNQKLKAFHQRPLAMINELSSRNAISRRKVLSYWYFEDQLKEVYASFVLSLNAAANDSVENNKQKGISAMYKLLASNPEQEKNLLAFLINKLGDPSQKVASKVIYCLGQLLLKHNNMQGVVLSEVEKLMFRPNVSSRTQYYSLCFLSQFYLCHEASDVAKKLTEVYFAFFKACVKKGDVDSRMMSALLTGINRAYPYAKIEFEKISQHIDTIYRLVQLANFNISLHALTLLYQVSDHGNNVNDRFYSSLYRKLGDIRLLTTTHQAMLLSLLYKAILKDKEVHRIKIFVKRLLQISLFTHPSLSCGILYLVSQLINRNKEIKSIMFKQTLIEGLEDDDEEKYRDVKDEIVNILSIKEEPLDDVLRHKNNQSSIIKSGKPNQKTLDLSTIELKEEIVQVKPDVEFMGKSRNDSSWFHYKINQKNATSHNKYNPLARNPLYAGGEFCVFTELLKLRNHFHPTISMYALSVLNGETVSYSGDPLKDFTLIRFLERFVFKNPKKIEKTTGVNPTLGKRKLYKPNYFRTLSINSATYLKEDSRNIPVDELFMYSFLQRRYQNKEDKHPNEDSDLESVQSEEFEDMLDKMSGFKDSDSQIDFMDEIGKNLKQTKRNKKKDSVVEEYNISDDDFESDDDLEGDEDDLDLNDEDIELIGDLDDDDEEDLELLKENKPKKNKNRKSGDINLLFASADEFATLLEEEGSSKVKPGGSNVFENKDNADEKQLAWEEKRNKWMKVFDKTVNKANFKGTKRNVHNKCENMSKKFKK